MRPDNGHPALDTIVGGANFEMMFVVIIILNALVMAVQFQYEGIGLGSDLEYRRYGVPKEQAWPSAKMAFAVTDYVFGAVFTLEVVLKCFALRSKFLSDEASVVA